MIHDHMVDIDIIHTYKSLSFQKSELPIHITKYPLKPHNRAPFKHMKYLLIIQGKRIMADTQKETQKRLSEKWKSMF